MTLIDTSSWVESFRRDGNPEVKEKVRRLILSGEAVFCEMVILELWNGAKGDYEKKQLSDFIEEIPCPATTSETWEYAYDLAKKCRKKGITIPAADLLILASALKNEFAIEHTDEHFESVLKFVF